MLFQDFPVPSARRPSACRISGCAALLLAADSLAAQDRPLDRLADEMEPTRTLVYKELGDRRLTLHLFEPEGHRSGDRRPVYLVIHGGGWTSRTPRYFYPFAKHFADIGMLGISLEYRLLDKRLGTTVFDSVKDARSAVRYLRARADELGIDPARIVVAGGSAGGHLAAGTALFDGIEGTDEQREGTGGGEPDAIPCRPDLLVLYYPVIDTSAAGYGQEKIGERWRDLSPVDQVKPSLPPTLLLHGTADTVTPFAGAERFHKLMLAAGNEIEFLVHRDGRHGYFLFDLALFAVAMQQTEEFLGRHGMLP